jgi:hypothetical protein
MQQVLDWIHGFDLGGERKDIYGYVASALVLTTFSMRSMLWLRISAIASNAAFIWYAVVASLPPILVLHAILLPLNIIRLAQLCSVRRYNSPFGSTESELPTP